MRLKFAALMGLAMVAAAGVQADDTSYIQDFKAVDNALVRHPAKYTGNPDVDFRKQLIIRRQNIIDMAEVALSRANDPNTVDLAQRTIDKQKRDIRELQQWLDAH